MLPADRADAIWQDGFWDTSADWTASRSNSVTRGPFVPAMGLARVSTQTTLTLRITDQGTAPGGIFVDECGLARAPIQSMNWTDQHRVPGGNYSLIAIGDSRFNTAAPNKFPWAVMAMQADSRAATHYPTGIVRSTAYRSDLTFRNDVLNSSVATSGARLIDRVGPVQSDCATAPVLTQIEDALANGPTAVVTHYDINDFFNGVTALANTGSGDCKTWPSQLGYLEDLVGRSGNTLSFAAFGTLPYYRDVTSNYACKQPDGTTLENCAAVSGNATMQTTYGQVGQ